MSGRTSKAVKGSVTGLLQHFIVMLLQLIIAPMILTHSGQDTLGGYAVIMQIVGYSILLDAGFSIALMRYLSQAHNPAATGNRFGELLTIGRNMLFLTNLLVAILLVIAAWNIEIFLTDSPNIQSSAQTALYLMATWAIFRTPIYIYSLALTATQDLATVNIIGIAVNVIRLISTIAFIYLGFGLPGLVTANILSELIGGFIQCFIFRQRHGYYRTEATIGNYKLGKEMLCFGMHYWGVNLSVVLLLGSDNLIAGAIYGATTASVFYTTKMFGSLLITLISRIIDHTYPGINQLIGSGDLRKVKDIYLRLIRYLLLLALPATIGTIVFLKELVTLWVGPDQFGGQFMAYTLALFVLIQVLCHLNGITTLALGKLKYWPTFSVGCGVIAVLGGYYMGKHYGMGWIPLSMAIAMMPLLGFLMLRLKKQLSIKQGDLLQATKPAFYVTAPLILFCYLTTIFTLPITYANTIGTISAFLSVWLGATWLIGLNRSEKQQVWGTINRYVFKN